MKALRKEYVSERLRKRFRWKTDNYSWVFSLKLVNALSLETELTFKEAETLVQVVGILVRELIEAGECVGLPGVGYIDYPTTFNKKCPQSANFKNAVNGSHHSKNKVVPVSIRTRFNFNKGVKSVRRNMPLRGTWETQYERAKEKFVDSGRCTRSRSSRAFRNAVSERAKQGGDSPVD